MEKTPATTFLRHERKQTDDSLSLERGKTDESFHKYRQSTQRKADDVLKRSRMDSDNERVQRRDVADSNSPDTEFKDKALVDERHVEDQSVRNERAITDAVIAQERVEKDKLVHALLNQERESTDTNLSFERSQTDLEVQRAASTLSDEQLAHATTRAALTTRDEFSAIVSHDLRNPVGAISSCAEMLLEDSPTETLSTELRDWIQFIKRNADSALRLIGDILDMERFAEGKLQLKINQHVICDLIRESVQTHSHAASAKSVLLRFSPPVARELAECDGDRISQVLSNLIGNAIKFTPEGGSVVVKIQQTEKEISVSVCDTGPGIPEELKNRIFERFAQLQNHDRRGLGLGLYISKMLVEAHHGKLRVDSKLAEGSTFTFTLPKERPQSQMDLH